MDDKKDGNFDRKSALAMEEVKLADVSGEDTKDTKAVAQDDCIAGPSKTPEDPPPAFVADISKDKVALAEFPVPPPAEAPPEFTTYEASVCTEGDGDVVSHDPHLNNDGAFELSACAIISFGSDHASTFQARHYIVSFYNNLSSLPISSSTVVEHTKK